MLSMQFEFWRVFASFPFCLASEALGQQHSAVLSDAAGGTKRRRPCKLHGRWCEKADQLTARGLNAAVPPA